ncbi:MAG: hypothetical protein ABTD50_10090 [Polyangiaceae bacterium]|jgi:hypothetical protein
MKQVCVSFVLVASLLAPLHAGAQERTPGASKGERAVKQSQGVLQIGEITIVGRVQKPVAVVDVAKIQPKLTLAELRQPFVDRIEEAVRKEPF